jgi:transcription elongation factor Elf1
MMQPAIDNPVTHKIPTVIQCLHAKNRSGAEIHCELCTVQGQNLVSEGTVKKMVYSVQRWMDDKWSESQLVSLVSYDVGTLYF